MYVLYVLYVRISRIPRILYITSYNLLYDLSYYSLLYSLIGFIIAYAIFINSLSSTLSNCDIYLIRSITLTFSFLSSSLKTFVISKLLIKSIVLPSLFASIYAKWLIIPKHPLLLQTQRRTKTVAFILSFSEVMPLCSRYIKEGLVYVIIAAPSSYQPSSYSECTWLNTYFSYNI